MNNARTYTRCKDHRLRAIVAVDRKPLCYACVVCILYADMPTEELSEMLGRPARAVSQMARKYGVYKSADYMATHACGRIQPGAVPPNKGLRRPGWAPGRMKETQFRKGERRGAANRNWKPVGSIRPDHEGFLRIKVREPHPGETPCGFGNTNIWPLYQRHLWEQHHGPIPPAHVIAFKDRNRENVAIDNLECITQADNMRRNTIHRYPTELRNTIMLLGATKRKIREAEECQKTQ